MQFQPGQSGNPNGRPPGSRNKKTLIAEEVLTAKAHETVHEIIRSAQVNDRTAMRLCMERLAPTGIDEPIELDLPSIEGPDDLIAAAGVIIKACGDGTISPRQTVCMLTAGDRLPRIVERVEQIKARREARRQAPAAAAIAAAANCNDAAL